MFLVILGLLVVLIVSGITFAAQKVVGNASGWVKDIIGSAVWTVMLAIPILLVVGMSIFFTTVSSANRMNTFYSVNSDYFIDARERLYEGVPKSLPEVGENGRSFVFFDSANYHQILPYASNVKETRDTFVKFNLDLTSHRYWQDSFLFGWYWANVSDDLKHVTVADNATIENYIRTENQRLRGIE